MLTFCLFLLNIGNDYYQVTSSMVACCRLQAAGSVGVGDE